jgi:tRNA-binding EMAP/Myf-like protein
MAQRTVAGVESFGMMCSADELGQGNNGNQIIDLGANAEVGTEYKLN